MLISSRNHADRGETGKNGEGMNTKDPSTLPTLTSSSNSDAPPTFLFSKPRNATICDSYMISWNYTGNAVVFMTLNIADIKRPVKPSLAKFTTPTSPLHIAPTVMRTLSTSVLSNAGNYTWNLVDVTEGWHIASAFETNSNGGIASQSDPFFVESGSDFSCLRNEMSSNSKHPTSYKPMRHAWHLITGEIVGIFVGAVFGAMLLTIAFLFPRLWRRELPSRKRIRKYMLY